METNHYDTVVHGGDLTGLLVASLLGRKGQRVLLLGHDRAVATFAAGPHTLTARPEIMPAPDAEPLRRIFAELNLLPILRRRAQRLRPGAQLVLPGGTVELKADDPTLASALAKAAGGPPDVVETILARLAGLAAALVPLFSSEVPLPPRGFWDRRELARVSRRLPWTGTDVLAPLGAQHPLRAALLGLTSHGTGFAPADLGTLPVAHALASAQRGLYLLDEHGPGLRALLTDRLTTLSVETRSLPGPIELVIRRGRTIGLRLGPRGEPIGLNHLVWAGPLSELPPLSDERPGRRLRDLVIAVHPACYRYCLSALLVPEAVPHGLGSRLFSVLDPARPLLEDNAIAITLRRERDGRGERVAVWIECLVPAGVVARDRSYLSFVRSRLFGHIARIFPTWDRHVLALGSTDDGLPAEIRGTTGLEPVGAPIPPGPMPAALSSDLPRSLDVSAAPHATGIRNFHIASAENLPGLGLEGQFIAAWNVTRAINAMTPRRRDGVGRTLLMGDT